MSCEGADACDRLRGLNVKGRVGVVGAGKAEWSLCPPSGGRADLLIWADLSRTLTDFVDGRRLDTNKSLSEPLSDSTASLEVSFWKLPFSGALFRSDFNALRYSTSST
jgi:hypothetical protein